jgi:uncharacterized protein (TIGR00369 family)
MSPDSGLDTILAAIRGIVTERIPFHKVLGLMVEALDSERVALRLPMRDELIGNFMRGVLHGGVISATLDVTGGLVALISVLKDMQEQSPQQIAARFARMGTIDLRIDYLRPGSGAYFIATGYVLRTGRRVAVTRMELHNDAHALIAVGTGAYSIS